MKRFKVLFGQRRVMVLVTLTILVLAAAALAASSASFTSRSTNPNNTFTAGGFTLTNEHQGVAVFNVANMRPNQTVDQSWWVRLQPGSVDGTVTVRLGNIQNPIMQPGGALSALLRVRVVDITAAPSTIIADQLLTDAVALGAVNVPGSGAGGAWIANEQHTFRVYVTWPNGAPVDDNLRAGAQSLFDITWDGTSV
jgi:hypothetical protein